MLLAVLLACGNHGANLLRSAVCLCIHVPPSSSSNPAGAGAVMQRVKLPRGTPASHPGASVPVQLLHFDPIPCYCAWAAAEDGSRTQAPAMLRGDSDTVPGFGLAWALPVVGGPGESEPTDEGWKIISLSLLFIIQIKTKYTIQTATVDNRRPIPTQRRMATPLRCYSVSLDFHFLWKLSQEFIYILGFSSTCL